MREDHAIEANQKSRLDITTVIAGDSI